MGCRRLAVVCWPMPSTPGGGAKKEAHLPPASRRFLPVVRDDLAFVNTVAWHVEHGGHLDRRQATVLAVYRYQAPAPTSSKAS